MNLLHEYLINLNNYPTFKKRNKWADKFLVKFAVVSLTLLCVKIAIEFLIESL